MPQSNLQGVEVGVADGGLSRITPEVRPQRPSRPVDRLARCRDKSIALIERAARSLAGRKIDRIAQKQALSRIPRIGLFEHQQMMRLIADKADVQQGVVP